jgi:curli biogenesis system outer membrane secretion channel CsgG
MVAAEIRLVIFLLLAASFASAQCASAPPAAAPSAPATVSAATAPSAEIGEQLLLVKRIYVDPFGDDAISKELYAAVISALTDSKRFIVTENKDKADATLRGNGLEKTSQEFHAYNSATSGGSAAGGYSSDSSGHVSGSWTPAGGSVSGSSSGHSSGGFHSLKAAISDSSSSSETINDARAAVRLVNRDGDVIWANTQESKGAKYKGAVADVAEQIVKQLIRDCEKAERRKAAANAAMTAPLTAAPSGKQ